MDTNLIGLLILVAVILLGGLVGGYAQYLSGVSSPATAGDTGQGTPPVAVRSPILLLFMGVVAAGCVPLFLSLVESKLIDGILEGGATRIRSVLIFAGLCLVAAFSSRRFIEAVSASVLQQLDEVKADAAEAKEQAGKAKQTAQRVAREIDSEAADEADEPPPAEASEDTSALKNAKASPPAPITPEERKVLEALTKRTYRTRHGIVEDSGIIRPRVIQILDALKDRKLALPTRSPSTGGGRWIITKRGEAALETRD